MSKVGTFNTSNASKEREKIVVVIDDATRDIMQRTWLDYIQKQNVIKGLIDDHKFDNDASVIQSEVFKAYEKQCQEANVLYDTAGNEMIARYEPDAVKGKNYNWNLDFEKCELTFELLS